MILSLAATTSAERATLNNFQPKLLTWLLVAMAIAIMFLVFVAPQPVEVRVPVSYTEFVSLLTSDKGTTVTFRGERLV